MESERRQVTLEFLELSVDAQRRLARALSSAPVRARTIGLTVCDRALSDEARRSVRIERHEIGDAELASLIGALQAEGFIPTVGAIGQVAAELSAASDRCDEAYRLGTGWLCSDEPDQ